MDQRLSQQDGADSAIRVDLLRRAGRMTDARQLVEETKLAIAEGDVLFAVLAFEELLVEKGDIASHTIAEALETYRLD